MSLMQAIMISICRGLMVDEKKLSVNGCRHWKLFGLKTQKKIQVWTRCEAEKRNSKSTRTKRTVARLPVFWQFTPEMWSRAQSFRWLKYSSIFQNCKKSGVIREFHLIMWLEKHQKEATSYRNLLFNSCSTECRWGPSLFIPFSLYSLLFLTPLWVFSYKLCKTTETFELVFE